MPKHERVGYERLELFIPLHLIAAVQKAAGKGSVTAWVCGVLAKATGVEYTPPKAGRPKKPTPAPKPRRRKSP